MNHSHCDIVLGEPRLGRLDEELPTKAQGYVKLIKEATGVRVRWVGVGPERDATIRR